MNKNYKVEIEVTSTHNFTINTANSQIEAEKKALDFLKKRIADEITTSTYNVNYCDVVEEAEEIMNYTNNHNQLLVDKINGIYNDKDTRIDFYKILRLLIKRDIEELEEFEGCEIAPDDILDEDYIYDYLMHVADNQDLETIISFCRC